MVARPRPIPKSRLHEVKHPELQRRGVRLYLKREDEQDPYTGGNKVRKLVPNLLEARRLGCTELVSFGGAASNHLVALAAAGRDAGFSTTGYVRDSRRRPSRVTRLARDFGMNLCYVEDAWFRRDQDARFLAALQAQHPKGYVLPESSANRVGIRAVADLVDELDVPFSHLCCACGSGATLAGLIRGLSGKRQALGVAVWRGEEVLESDVRRLLQAVECNYENWRITFDYHLGGFGRADRALRDTVAWFRKEQGVRLDARFTGKLLLAIVELAQKGYFQRGDAVVGLHTALPVTTGLQNRMIGV